MTYSGLPSKGGTPRASLPLIQCTSDTSTVTIYLVLSIPDIHSAHSTELHLRRQHVAPCDGRALFSSWERAVSVLGSGHPCAKTARAHADA